MRPSIIVVNGSCYSLEAETCRSDTFINNLEQKMECTLTMLPDDPKSGGNGLYA